MIQATALAVRHGGTDLSPTTLRLAAGRHALLGRKEDGVSALLACIAGEAKARRGVVRVHDADPRDPRTRTRIGWVPLGLRLPDALRVDEVIAVGRAIRGDAAMAAGKVLEPLGLGALERRVAGSLDAGEARAVALAEVLASAVATVILVEEPFVAMAPQAAAALPQLLRARGGAGAAGAGAAGASGACIVVSTASAHDASLLATDFALFDRGRLLRVVADADTPLRTAGKARLHVEVSDARALAGELAKDTAITHLELRARAVVVDADDITTLAAAVRDAIAASGVEVERIQPVIASVEMLRADAAGALAGAYDAARTKRAAQPAGQTGAK